MSALVGAISWNLITWYFGIPSSSSHALIGGLIGVGVAAGITVNWDKVIEKVAIPMVVSPVLGFCGAYAVMILIMWVFRRARPRQVNHGFRLAQILSAAMLSFGHGLQDAQKTMGVIVLALVAAGRMPNADTVPTWVIAASASAISLGTFSGGMRIMRTMGRRIIHLDPPRAFAAELTASFVLYFMAIGQARPRVNDAHHDLIGDGRGRHQAAPRGAMGHRTTHRDGLGHHVADGRRSRRAHVRRSPSGASAVTLR